MSLEITLGLLSALTGNLYAACQYWLQALSRCNKNCLFSMQRQFCCMLLPDGVKSLDNLLRLSRELCSVDASNGPEKAEDVTQLFQHFHAYYYKALVTELWYRYPGVLEIFRYDQHVSVEEEVEKGHEIVISTQFGISEGDLPSDSIPRQLGITSAISESGQANGEVEAYLTGDEVNQNKAYDLKEPLSSRKSEIVGRQDLMSTLKNSKAVLLSDHHMQLSNLRALLTEIRKTMLLKRSRQFLQLGSAGSQLKQKKKKDKKPKTQSVHPVGFSTSTSDGGSMSETASRSSSVEAVESSQAENGEDERALTEHSESLVEATDKPVRDKGDIKNTGATEDENECPAANDSVENEVSGSEGDLTKGLTTLDGRLPVDLRFVASDTSLEFLAEEEEKVLAELEKFEWKVCYF